MRRLLWCLLVLLLPVLPLVTAAQDEKVSDTVGKHVVQPGDTLWTITGQYLGDDSLWKENWRLNPQVTDPNKLRIGQELTVITERKIEARSAVLRAVSNQVDKNLRRTEWQRARPGDQLAERDGVRTREASSAELQFSNAALLRLGEYSQIFLQEKRTSLRGVDQGKVEIKRGSAELVFEPMSRRKTEIEIIAGSSVTRPRADASGRGRIGAGTDEQTGRSRVMVYSGQSTVEASGQSVQLPTGTGSAIPREGPPSPPEKLLSRPRGLLPAAGSAWPVANMPVSWQAVDGAAVYLVDICGDDQCAELLQHSGPQAATRWQPAVPRTGDLFWRVRAVSASGLEGYASAAQSFALASTRIDVSPPALAAVPEGPLIGGSDRWRVGADSQLALTAFDPGIGVDWIEYRWPGQPWQRTAGDVVRVALRNRPPAAGAIEFRAADQMGQVSSVTRVALETEGAE